jgi:hypothetical protein
MQLQQLERFTSCTSHAVSIFPRSVLFVPSTVMQLNTGQSVRLSAAFTLTVHFREILCELSAFGIYS